MRWQVGALAVAALLGPRVANACGGCFHEGSTVGGTVLDAGGSDSQVVTDHRMVLALSSTQTTLWDQIRYAGSPDQFIWVLPIEDASVVQIALANNAFIDALDQRSTPQVISPVITCTPTPGRGGGASTPVATRSTGYGCGGGGPSSFGYDPGGSDAGPSSTTLHGPDDTTGSGRMGEAVVGPYAAEIVSEHAGDAPMDQWLVDHGYALPDAERAIVRYYVDRRSDFVVLHLRPGEGVQAMQPVRVTLPGYSPVLPLRMVGAGAADEVGLTLMVVGRGSYEPQNFRSTLIPASRLAYDFRANRSNYRELFASAVADGNTWVLESSQTLLEGAMEYDAGAPDDPGPTSSFDGGEDDVASEDDAVSMPQDADAPASMDAGWMASSGDDPLVDRGVAFAGLDGYATLTRLRTVLRASSLDRDLMLQPSEALIPLPRIGATLAANPPSCPSNTTMTMTTGSAPPTSSSGAFGGPGCACRAVLARGARRPAGPLFALVVVGLVARRVRRRRR